MLRRLLLGGLLVACACGKAPERPAPAPTPTGTAPTKAEAPPTTPAAAADDVDIPGFCRRTMAAANPDQCWGRDENTMEMKVSFCIDVLETPLRAGKITIDETLFAQCEKDTLAAIATMDNHRSPTDLAERFDSCRRAVTGKLAAGADCVGTMECAPGLVCKAMKCAQPDALGAKCLPMIEVTMAVRDSTCADGLYCSLKENATCLQRVAKGGACVITGQCAEGLYCRGGKCGPPTKPTAGGECDDHPDCVGGEMCDFGHCKPKRKDGERCLVEGNCEHQCVDDTCAPCP